MTLGGRVTLIKFVLSSIPINVLSCFICPSAVLKKIKRIRYDIMWNDKVEKRKYHMVSWNVVSQPIACGGLGIRSLFTVNKALIGKWSWRLGDVTEGLWRRIIGEKYIANHRGAHGSGWLKPSPLWVELARARLSPTRFD